MDRSTTDSKGCCGARTADYDEERLTAVTEGFQLLAHPVRLRIVEILAADPGEVCVCDLEAALPVKQPTVSHHLRILRDAGLVGFTKRGQWAHYAVHREALAELAINGAAWLRSVGGPSAVAAVPVTESASG